MVCERCRGDDAFLPELWSSADAPQRDLSVRWEGWGCRFRLIGRATKQVTRT